MSDVYSHDLSCPVCMFDRILNFAKINAFTPLLYLKNRVWLFCWLIDVVRTT